MKRMPAPSAAPIRPVSASRDIIVPVGLAGLPTSTPFNGVLRCAASNASPVSAWRVSFEVSISTGSQPSAVRIWREGGETGTGTVNPAPGSDNDKNAQKKPPDGPVGSTNLLRVP